MGIETTITCDVCGKTTGESGTGSRGEYISCDTHTPSGLVYAVLRTKIRWAICRECWNTMWIALREHQNPNVECHVCGKTLKRDDAAKFHFCRGACVWNSGIKSKITVRTNDSRKT